MALPSDKIAKKRRIRLRRSLLITTAVVLPIAALVPFGFGFITTWNNTRLPCAGNPDAPQMSAVISLAYTSVSVPARWGGAYRGIFVSGPLDATIIIPPTFNAGQDGALRELAMFAGHGYNVLTYESR